MLKVQAWLWASAVITPPLVAFGDFDGLQGPRLRPAFEATEPWCRQGKTEEDGTALWVRRDRDLGARPARGCLGRLISVATNGEVRPDVDPGAAALGPAPNDPVLTAEATLNKALTASEILQLRSAGITASSARLAQPC